MHAISDADKAAVAHLKKSLRALHMAYSVALTLPYGEDVVSPLRVAINQVHRSLDVLLPREGVSQEPQSIDAP